VGVFLRKEEKFFVLASDQESEEERVVFQIWLERVINLTSQ
jgi:hypothetical protein